MSSYAILKSLNPKRVFILQKSELEKRFDPFFYVPELLELEKKVLAKKPKKLRDYVVSVSSGATPKTTESELYYAEKENGIPFLRVQNLSPTGVLEFDDCKYINHETHNGMLKRSQVSAGDLLVKITGVGRMAVASVAPEGFIGNINQHVCIIKTGSKEISETLAAFLNSDIGEKLASRRSAGGTRPALDYPALLSIPIIEDKRILQITNKVIEQKQKNEAEAEKLLSSIEDYLLKELGIELPEPLENILKNRMFTATISKLSGSRFDPRYYQSHYLEFYDNLDTLYPTKKIKDLSDYIGSGSTPRAGGDAYTDDETKGVPFIRITNLKNDTVLLDDVLFIKREIHENSLKRTQLKSGDILLSMAGTIGLTVIVPDFIVEANINQALARIVLKSDVNKFYVKEILNSKIGKTQTDRLSRPSVQANINFDEIGALLIPIPPLDKQKEIANHITNIRQQAQQLKDKTKELLKKASEEIEEILLN
jgi:restriction endonuclease S subunit